MYPADRETESEQLARLLLAAPLAQLAERDQELRELLMLALRRVREIERSEQVCHND